MVPTVTDTAVWSVCLSVCPSQLWALQKWLNWLRCHSGCCDRWGQEACIRWGVHIGVNQRIQLNHPCDHSLSLLLVLLTLNGKVRVSEYRLLHELSRPRLTCLPTVDINTHNLQDDGRSYHSCNTRRICRHNLVPSSVPSPYHAASYVHAHSVNSESVDTCIMSSLAITSVVPKLLQCILKTRH